MIRRVKFSNFYSFNEEQEINFLANKKTNYVYLQSSINEKEQISKVAGFIGGNASGKTNIMRLFSFLSFFICEERRRGRPDIGFKTFFNNNKKSSFEVEFEIDDLLYTYEFKTKANHILSEKLSEKKGLKGSRNEIVFSRIGKNIETLHEGYFEDFPIDYLKNIRQDISLIAFMQSHYEIDIITKIFTYFNNAYTNINELGQRNNTVYSNRSAEAYLEDKDLKNQMKEFIRRFDVGIENIHIDKEEKDEQINISVFATHQTNERLNKIPFHYESSGTQSLFCILAPLITALRRGGLVIIDEIETGLHPEAVKKIIDYFIDENEEGKAQLIFSSHAVSFLKDFDMQQIFLVSKKQFGGSYSYRLDSVEGVRSDENFLAKYMSGVYASFPNIKV